MWSRSRARVGAWVVGLGCAAALLLGGAAEGAAQEELWPNLMAPGPQLGSGNKDVAVVVGIEDYWQVSDVPGAVGNALAWVRFLRQDVGVPQRRIKMLLNSDATAESIEKVVDEASKEVEPGGRVWFVFIGHGAASKDGKDGVLVGADARQSADSIYSRSVSREAMLGKLSRSRSAQVVAVLDTCFSGRTTEGGAVATGLQPLLIRKESAVKPKVTVFTAGRGDQFAGPLPGASRPAFSYLMLGALRGWADANRDGQVTEGEAVDYVDEQLAFLLSGKRSQSPELWTQDRNKPLLRGRSLERGPDMMHLMQRMSGDGGVAKPQEKPREAPREVAWEAPPVKQEAPASPPVGGNLSGMTFDVLQRRVAAMGWQVLDNPKVQRNGSYSGLTLPIVKGEVGGAASLYEYQDPAAARAFDEAMRKQGAAAVRDGSRVVTVLIPGDARASQRVMEELLSGAAQAPAAQRGGAGMSGLTFEGLRRAVQADGWQVLNEPQVQRSSAYSGLTLPIVKGDVGGAASLYEYQDPAAARAFDEAMQKQGAATARDGNRVATVLFPGNPALGREVLGRLLGQPGGQAQAPSAQSVRTFTHAMLQQRLEAAGWTVLGEPSRADAGSYRGVTLPIVKGAKGGAASIYEYDDLEAAKTFESSMRRQGAAARREGGKVMTVLFPGDNATAESVLRGLLEGR